VLAKQGAGRCRADDEAASLLAHADRAGDPFEVDDYVRFHPTGPELDQQVRPTAEGAGAGGG
jgi:hypothetical protein